MKIAIATILFFISLNSKAATCEAINKLTGSWKFVSGTTFWSYNGGYSPVKAIDAEFELTIGADGLMSISKCLIRDEDKVGVRCHTGEFIAKNNLLVVKYDNGDEKTVGSCNDESIKLVAINAPFGWPGTPVGNHKWTINLVSDGVNIEGSYLDDHMQPLVKFEAKFQRP